MNVAKQFEKKFELVPTDDPKLVGFKVALNNEFFTPDDVPNFVTAYSAWTYRNSLRSAWDAYVYVRTEEDKGETWFHFIPSLPSSVKITQRNDPIWGVVTVYEYLQNTTSTQLPTIAQSTSGYAPISTAGYVLNAEEKPIAKGLSQFIVETVSALTVTVPFSRFDDESGGIVSGNKIYALAIGDPGTTAVDANGKFVLSNRVSHNVYEQTEDYVTALPISYVNALTWDTQDKIYWPPVLVDWEFNVVLASTLDKFTKLLHTSIREGFSGDVNVQRKIWWQKEQYTIPAAEVMIPARISIDGNLESPSVRETLHGEFVYHEENYVAPLDSTITSIDHKIITWTFGSTNVADWPSTITRVEQTQYKGGFKCLEEVFTRPADYDASQAEKTERLWVDTDGSYY